MKDLKANDIECGIGKSKSSSIESKDALRTWQPKHPATIFTNMNIMFNATPMLKSKF